MALRNVVLVNPAPGNSDQRLQRIVITDDTIAAIWAIRTPGLPDRNELRVEVSAALYANLSGRAAYQNFIDNVRDDTSSRIS